MEDDDEDDVSIGTGEPEKTLESLSLSLYSAEGAKSLIASSIGLLAREIAGSAKRERETRKAK